MTKEQAQHVAQLIAIVNIAQEKGALKLGDAKAAIISIDALAPTLESILNPKQEPAAVLEAQA